MPVYFIIIEQYFVTVYKTPNTKRKFQFSFHFLIILLLTTTRFGMNAVVVLFVVENDIFQLYLHNLKIERSTLELYTRQIISKFDCLRWKIRTITWEK